MAGKYFIIITFVVLAIPTFLFGQSLKEVTIYGVVTDILSGQPLAKVLIEVINEADSSERTSGMTDCDGKYRVKLLTKSEVIQDEGQLPQKFGLMQNYPNPFNPSTMIQFKIPYMSDTRILIYNTLGQKIRTLIKQQLPKDTYLVEWDGTNDAGNGVAAGIYFYQLRTSDYVETRKMIMLDGHFNGTSSPSEVVIHRQSESDKMASLWVTLRASSPYIQTLERRRIAISSLMVESNLCIKCIAGLFNQECISVSELIHNSQVYIGGLPGAVTKEIDSSVTATIINQRTGWKDTAHVNINGSFSLIRTEALEGDSISLMLYEEGQPVSGPEPLIIPETIQPKVMDSKPTNGDKDIIIDAVITVYFSEPIETATVNNNSFYLTDSLGNQVQGTIGFIEGNTIAYLDPNDSLEYASVYTIAVTTDVEDLQGLHLVKVYMATFSTCSPTSQGVIINVPVDVPTIQAGIDSASDGNIVLVEDGTYLENINFKGKAITVASHFEVDGDTSHISNTIINGSQPSNPDSGSVVYFVSGEDTTSILRGFTITGGTGTKWGTNQHTGGGILLWSGGKVESNKIINNHLTNTGGTYTHGAGGDLQTEGNAVVRNNLIAHNSIDAWWGGGAGVVMACSDTASILFDQNILRNNIYNADGGLCSGGAYIAGMTEWHGKIVIRNNLIMRNHAISTVANNGLAGGLHIESASPEIFNNIIAENNTSGRGGGIFVGTDASGSPGNPIIINNTIINNNAVTGGGIYNWWSTNNPLVMNTILWGNTASQQGNEIYRQAGNITVVYSDIAGGYTGEGNISKEPMLQGENYGLSDSSSCIGAGIDQYTSGSTTYYCPGACFLGNPRPNPSGSHPDIGACESSLHSPLVNLEPIPPVVLYSEPANEDEEVNVDAVIKVYFSEPIEPASVNNSSFYLTDSLGNQIPGIIGFLTGNTIAYLDPEDSLKYLSSYTIIVTTDVVDLLGLQLQSTYTATFYTEHPPSYILDFKVNDDPGTTHQGPSISADSAGKFVITWCDNRNGDLDIYAQRYASDGNLLGANFKVNDDQGNMDQYNPSISVAIGGDFIVTWGDYRNGNGDIYAQRYANNGSPIANNFKVNGNYSGGGPSIAIGGNENFVITWSASHNFIYDIYAQRYNSDGIPLGSNFRVNDISGPLGLVLPCVAMDGSGNFVIAWTDEDLTLEDIHAQRYSSDGSPLGNNFTVNDANLWGIQQWIPSIAMNHSGNFVIAWDDDRNGNGDIYAQCYASDGSPSGPNFKVSDNQMFEPGWNTSISMDDSGKFVITWDEGTIIGTGSSIYAQRYSGDGSPIGNNIIVNHNSQGFHYGHNVVLKKGRIYCAWSIRGDIWANVFPWEL